MARNNPHSKSAKKTASRTGLTSKALLFTLPLAIPAALWSGQLRLPSALQHYLWPAPAQQVEVESPSTLELCPSHRYTTEIVSLDPLIIYINNFTSPEEARDLIKAGYLSNLQQKEPHLHITVNPSSKNLSSRTTPAAILKMRGEYRNQRRWNPTSHSSAAS